METSNHKSDTADVHCHASHMHMGKVNASSSFQDNQHSLVNVMLFRKLAKLASFVFVLSFNAVSQDIHKNMVRDSARWHEALAPGPN